MYAARRSYVPTAALLVALAYLPCTALAQVQPQSTPAPNVGMLTPSTTNTAAVSELRAALDGYAHWTFQTSVQHSRRALELEPNFGIARAIIATVVGGPTATGEFARAAAEGSFASAPEALLTLAARESNAGRTAAARRIFQTAAELTPNDRQVAAWRALNLADTARVNAFRDIATRFPDYAPARTNLALYLTPLGSDSIVKANGDEALRIATEAVRLEPQTSTSHTAVAHVLVALHRFPEAQAHLTAATSMTPKSFYSYQLLATIANVEGRIPDVRVALDSAIALTPNVGDQFGYRRAFATTFLSEGNVQQAQASLAQQLKDAQAIGANNQVAFTHQALAIVAAGIRDSAGAEQHLAAVNQTDAGAGPVADNRVIVLSLIGNAASARSALGDYIRISGPQPGLPDFTNSARTQNVHRMTGLVLLAEKKPQEAIAELRQGGSNPYATLGIIESYKMAKDNKQADAERTAFFGRKEFSYASTAAAIIRYRAKK